MIVMTDVPSIKFAGVSLSVRQHVKAESSTGCYCELYGAAVLSLVHDLDHIMKIYAVFS